MHIISSFILSFPTTNLSPPHHLPHLQVSAIFIPYEVNAGASAAVFGLLGVLYVELFQFWQIVDHAWFELLKLSVFVVILLLLGTLPYVDNMAHVGTCTLVTRVFIVCGVREEQIVRQQKEDPLLATSAQKRMSLSWYQRALFP